ncbi:cell division protein ZapA [Alishewanella sp. d11]|uniref:cell division protein ZapA n=1 Tax=Alishewanella sp. d11 TaxID=3414030 RepID=UPI003BF8B27C
MSAVESCKIEILGRAYRFKHPSDKLQQLMMSAAELEARLTAQTIEQSLVTRDQLLVATAINLLSELAEQKQETEQQLCQLLQKIAEAE